MNSSQSKRSPPDSRHILPGHGFHPLSPTNLWSVTGSGVVVTLYDRIRQAGGMAHFYLPTQQNNRTPSSIYALPAILSLLAMLQKYGTQTEHLEAQLCGGASNPAHHNYSPFIHQENIDSALSLLKKKNIKIVSQNTGGQKARKILFNTGTSETMFAQVSHVRHEDWYPQEE